jgi:hypothetical protein
MPPRQSHQPTGGHRNSHCKRSSFAWSVRLTPFDTSAQTFRSPHQPRSLFAAHATGSDTKGVFAANSSAFAAAATNVLCPSTLVPLSAPVTATSDSATAPNLLPRKWTDPCIFLSPNSQQWVTDITAAIATTQHVLGVIHPDTGDTVKYPKLLQSSEGQLLEESCSEEMGQLTNGYKQEAGTKTMHCIHVSDIPAGLTATYLCIITANRPTKAQTRSICFTVGSNRVNYPGDTSTKMSGLTTAKLLFNSEISTPNARFMTADIKDF